MNTPLIYPRLSGFFLVSNYRSGFYSIDVSMLLPKTVKMFVLNTYIITPLHTLYCSYKYNTIYFITEASYFL